MFCSFLAEFVRRTQLLNAIALHSLNFFFADVFSVILMRRDKLREGAAGIFLAEEPDAGKLIYFFLHFLSFFFEGVRLMIFFCHLVAFFPASLPNPSIYRRSRSP